MEKDTLLGWIPLSLSMQNGESIVDWGYMGGERFIEPFCQDTLQKIASAPFNRLFRQHSDLDLLRKRTQCHPGLPLQGMVFHMSRCGSTLVAQWLAALPDSVVLSEPEPLDTLLQYPAPDNGTETILGLLAALGQPRRANDRCLFLKTDCWHMAHIDRLLEAFPDTPWIFLYRDPVEVLVSHQLRPGRQLVPGSISAHGLHAPEEVMNTPLAHGAWILSMIMQQAAQAIRQHGKGLLLNYSDLMQTLNHILPKHFAIPLDVECSAIQHAVLKRDAKRPYMAFQTDIVKKRSLANTELLALAKRWLNTPYQELEQLRAKQDLRLDFLSES